MTKQSNGFTVVSENLTYEFSPDGFIKNIQLFQEDGEALDVMRGDFGRLRITLADGRTLIPFVPKDIPPRRKSSESAELVIFDSILWKTSDGSILPDFRLALHYEFREGGRAFVSAFFFGGGRNAPPLNEFSLKFHLALAAFPEVNWACLPRPRTVDGTLIQSLASGRYLERGKEIHADREIVPSVNFNARHPGASSAYFELFVEGQNALDESADNNFTDLKWNPNGDFSGEWGFVRETPCISKPLHVFQWRNQWGWILKTADRKRQKPPLHLYHYFDNEKRYPSTESINAMAAAGTDVLTLHECWRYDLQNGGIPFDPEKLRRVVEDAHRNDIRVLLYMRGNEPSATEDACQWFEQFLKKDYDGLYMDYGGPFHFADTDESYPGGRIHFRNYFLHMKRLRARVGANGLLLVHTGPSFSAIGFTGGLVDGYVSGEGESGVMVDGRREYEYYSMASVCPGTMWTGAFPAYSSSRMRPFLAASGHYPHNPLGVQFPSSSLAHPEEPGLNDIPFKPLWKLWRIFRKEHNISIFNDYNSSGIFPAESGIGHYLMISADSRRALLILANFKDTVNEASRMVNWEKTGFPAASASAWLLQPGEEKPGKACKCDPLAPGKFSLDAHDVAALWLTLDPAKDIIRDFETDYPPLSESNKNYLDYIAKQKSMRDEAPPTKKLFLRISLPPSELPYEFSLVYDLYLNTMELVEFKNDDSVHCLGWITKEGLSAEKPAPENYIWPAEKSVWIPLHNVLSPGKHTLGIRSRHYGKPFYSFLYAELSTNPDGKNAARLEFVNELEPDRQYLHWTTDLK